MLHLTIIVYYCLLQFSGNVLQYARDSLTTIVFTSTEFNICLMYDTLIGLHSVWKIRKPTDEVMCFIKNENECKYIFISLFNV